ncbi:MFS-type transporter SLC18B1 [Halotydeus destructor]|nr:MFS-type transporter SLC18B1 [Halotydeus destructor]
MSLTIDQVFQLCFIALLDFAVFMPYSVMGPIFPEEALSKGLTQTTSGLIFSTFPLFNILTYPVAGYLLPRVGLKSLLISALFLNGSTQMAFGGLHYIDDAMWFTYSCMLVRSLTSIGAAICQTCIIFRIFQAFPDQLNLAFAVQETSMGVGQALGPLAVALCALFGGYELSFYATGMFSLAIMLLACCQDLKGDVSSKTEDKPSNWQLLNWELVPITFALVVIGLSFGGFTGPTLEPHLAELSLADSTISYIFSGFTVSYTVSSIVIGHFADKLTNTRKLMVIGNVISALCYLALGPSPWTNINNSLLSNVLSVTILGVSLGMSTVPSFGILLQSLTSIGYQDNLSTTGLVSAFWLTVYTLGEFLGTSFGGYLVDTFGFITSTQIVALLNAISAILLCIRLFRPKVQDYEPISGEEI